MSITLLKTSPNIHFCHKFGITYLTDLKIFKYIGQKTTGLLRRPIFDANDINSQYFLAAVVVVVVVYVISTFHSSSEYFSLF